MTGSVRSIVFDFDGVLVDSNRLKRRAYYEVFEGMPVSPSAIADCLMQHAEGDRHDVIGCIVGALERDPLARASLVSRCVDAYGRRCDEQIIVCPEIPGATEVLTRLAANYPLFVNSATPVESLQQYVIGRNWAKLFRGILGRPATKVDNFRNIREREQIDTRNLLFVGDRQSDLNAAKDASCQFVGVRSDESDFTEAADVLETIARLPDYVQALEHTRC